MEVLPCVTSVISDKEANTQEKSCRKTKPIVTHSNFNASLYFINRTNILAFWNFMTPFCNLAPVYWCQFTAGRSYCYPAAELEAGPL